MAACGRQAHARCDARVIGTPVGLALLGASRANEEVTMTRQHGRTVRGSPAWAGSAGRATRCAGLAARCAILAALAAVAAGVAGCSSAGRSGPGSAPVASLAAGGQTGHRAVAQLTQEQSDLDML